MTWTRILTFAFVLALASADAAVLVDTRIGGADSHGAAATGNGALNERMQGEMPRGWTDDSVWAKSWTRYEILEDADYTAEGLKFFRINVERVESGAGQIKHDLPDLVGEGIYRLSLKLRSPAKSPSWRIGLRMKGSPYTWLWQQGLAPREQWQDLSWDFMVTPPKGLERVPVCLILTTQAPAVLDLAAVRLERSSRAEMLAEVQAARAAGGSVNLLRQSRFPLGPQTGWSIDRDLCDELDVRIDADPAVTGPSGSPALRIEALREGVKPLLRSAPFPVPLSTEIHTASLSVKGDGLLRLGVRHADPKNARAYLNVLEFIVRPADGWKRVEVCFQPVLLGKFHYLEMQTQGGSLWVDALQVEPGDTATAYRSPAPCEVSLALPTSTAARAGVQFAEEVPEIRWCVTGEVPGAAVTTLVLRTVDADGEEVAAQRLPLSAGFLREGQVCWLAPGKERLGPFRIEAWVEQAGQAVSPVAEIVVLRLRRPRHCGQDAPDSPFGVHVNPTARHLTMAKAIGINWVRLHDAGLGYIGWAFLEPEKGTWTFHDDKIARYRARHLKISAELGTSPKWAGHWPEYGRKDFGYHDWFSQPKDLADYANYVRTVVSRYREQIDTWFLWNEPYWASAWNVAFDPKNPASRHGYLTSREPAADFARLMAIGYRTAKEANPAVTVVGGCTRHTADGQPIGREWTAALLKNGYLESCDILEYHQYTGGPLLFPNDRVKMGRGCFGPLVEAFGTVPKPVWMTEGSAVRDITANGMYRHTLPSGDTENVRATGDLLCRYVISLLANGTGKIFLYSMHSQGAVSGLNPADWRVLVTTEGALHPSGAAFSNMAYLLEDRVFRSVNEVADGVFAYAFAGAEGTVTVLAPKVSHAKFAIPDHAYDLFGNPLPSGSDLGSEIVYVVPGGIPSATPSPTPSEPEQAPAPARERKGFWRWLFGK